MTSLPPTIHSTTQTTTTSDNTGDNFVIIFTWTIVGLACFLILAIVIHIFQHSKRNNQYFRNQVYFDPIDNHNSAEVIEV